MKHEQDYINNTDYFNLNIGEKIRIECFPCDDLCWTENICHKIVFQTFNKLFLYKNRNFGHILKKEFEALSYSKTVKTKNQNPTYSIKIFIRTRLHSEI